MRKSVTVSELNAYVKDALESDPLLKGIILIGEISGFKKYPSGHSYFVLKDQNSSINAVLFAQYSSKSFVPANGMLVEALGSVSLYTKEGRYQFIVKQLKPAGIGALYLQYEKLKEQLQKEGLFDKENKKSIPRFPKCVGVITSGKGAAVRDIINVIRRRYPLADILIRPVAVQGIQAAPEIVAGIEDMNMYGRADVLIVGRGGGSQEDLWAFNTEIVARAIAASEIPVISAVGHETDITISDFVADLRAPTPSAAAELSVPDVAELRGIIGHSVQKLSDDTFNAVEMKKKELVFATKNLKLLKPSYRLEQNKALLQTYIDRLRNETFTTLLNREHKVQLLSEQLKQLNPKNIMGHGYTIIEDCETHIITSANSELPEQIQITWIDGVRKIKISEQMKVEE